MIFGRILGIGACDPKGVMGKNGQLPWHHPEDLQHFSDTTRGSPMIMGHHTFLSLPVKYFEGRKTIIFTRTKPQCTLPDQLFVSSIREFLSLKGSCKDLYVIGGAQIYSLFIQENLIQEFILTKLKNVYNGDTFFPISLLDGWAERIIRETNDFTIHRYFNPRECVCT
jgi:dihydrofolate reductase